MCRSYLLRGASACALSALLVASPAFGQQALPAIDVGAGRAAKPKPSASHQQPSRDPVQAAATPQPQPQPKPEPIRRAIPDNVPAVVESVTRQQIDKTVNVMTTAETMKYMPSILVRERFIGDRNAILQSTTTTPISGAQNLVYADNILLSNLLGNTFSTAPRWGMVSPAEIDRIDMIYGPYSALYPGNSMGGVMTITTRMPEGFEVHANSTVGFQRYGLYQSQENNIAGDMNILVGHKIGDFSFWASYDRLDAQGQSQTFPGGFYTCSGYGAPCSTLAPPAVTKGLFGGVVDYGETGFLRLVNGSAGQDHNQSHMGKIKADYEYLPKHHATYQLGFWNLYDDTFVKPYVTDSHGVPIYSLATSNVKIGPLIFPFTSLNPTHSGATHLMQAISLKSDTKGLFDYDLSMSSYNYLRDYTNTAAKYGLIPTATDTRYSINPAGSNVNLGGSYWRTFDAKGILRPEAPPPMGKHEVTVGGHFDEYGLSQVTNNTADWPSNFALTTASINQGRTHTAAAMLQDVWYFQPDWKLTLGGREEWWTAFDGLNHTLSQKYQPALVYWPPVVVTPPVLPGRYLARFSPKGAIEHQFSKELTLRGSVGNYYRFPTDLEMFANVAGPNSVTVSNPNLKPEQGTAYDLTGEYVTNDLFGLIGQARQRVSLRLEDRWNAIITQVDNTTGIPVSQNANMGKAVFRTIEGAVEYKDVVWHGLDYTGSVTYVDPRIESNPKFPEYNGMQYPRVPTLRIRSTLTYAPTKDYSVSMGFRYATHGWVSPANTDFNFNNYGSTDSEQLVFDVKATYKLDANWTLSAGVDNIGRWKYYVNPNPYPQRVFYFGLKYDFGGPEQKTAAASAASLGGDGAPGASGSGGGGSPMYR